MINSKFLKLQHFFLVNRKIKDELYNICPPFTSDAQDMASIAKYTDHTYDSLNYILCELNCVASDFINDLEILAIIDKHGQNIRNEFIRCGLDIDKLRIFYKNCISSMNPEFLDLIKSECVGYTTSNLSTNIVNHVTTINEMLHLLHSYIMNNEEIYQSLPKINEKQNGFSYPISLYGEKNEFANMVFSKFPIEIDCGWTDIVSISNEKVIMMIRDRGHALTIEITKIGSNYHIEYFIPKLCNIEMINNLPGINKVKEGAPGATGVFETDNILDLYNFINSVPTDSDMVFDEYTGLQR